MEYEYLVKTVISELYKKSWKKKGNTWVMYKKHE